MQDVTPLSHGVEPDPLRPLPRCPGSLTPRHTWDLHGMTVSQAHELTLNQIHQLHSKYKYVTFITGKSGQMNQEFRHWLDRHPQVRNIEVSNDGGAYRVWFKKARQKKK